MASQIALGSTKAVTVLPFVLNDIADADGTFTFANGTGTQFIAPYGGSIIGWSGSLTAAIGGTLTVHATIDGSLSPAWASTLGAAAAADLGATDTQGAYQTHFTFSAGARLGLMYTKVGTITPITSDFTGGLVVLFDEVRY